MVATKSILAKRDLSKRDPSKSDRPRKRPPASAPRREGVVDRVRDEGQTDHHEDQRRAREEPQPPGYPQETLRLAGEVAETDRIRVAEPEESEARLRPDGPGDEEREGDERRRQCGGRGVAGGGAAVAA